MTAYYNEIDPFKAEVLREAIKAGAIAPGDVDERSIADVRPADLVGYRQWHFFAGGGFWSLALRNAGWPDDRPVATLSCPCPSFSAAGKGAGFDDPRHLWPEAFRIIRECRFPVVIGEQVAAAIGHGWLDLVSGDLEAEGYAVAAAVLGAHSAGAPHIRQRLYFCAHALHAGRAEWRPGTGDRPTAGNGGTGQRAESDRAGCEAFGTRPKRTGISGEVGLYRPTGRRADSDGGQSGDGDVQRGGEYGLLTAHRGTGQRADAPSLGQCADESGRNCADGFELAGAGAGSDGCDHSSVVQRADAGYRGEGSERRSESAEREGFGGAGATLSSDNPLSPRLEGHFGDVREWRGPGWLDPQQARSVAEAGTTRGFWADCDWWYGRDGKYRPAGPGIQPLAHGSPARVGRLRLYGDAICVPTAQAFISGVFEVQA